MMERGRRLAFIDHMRGLALLIMLSAHVSNACLGPTLRQGAWFLLLDFIHGLAAPIFLFLAGFCFFLQGQGKPRPNPSYPLRGGLARILCIWLVGYALNLPGLNPLGWINLDEEAWRNLLKVDILHCIASGLLLLWCCRLLFPRQDALAAGASLLGLSAALLAPALAKSACAHWVAAPHSWHSWYCGYVAASDLSLFPLFPWFGFMAAGLYTARQWCAAQHNQTIQAYMQSLACWSLAATAIGALLLWLGKDVAHLIANERSHPFFFLERLGAVLALFSLFFFTQPRQPKNMAWLAVLGGETLLLYALHLKLLYFPLFAGQSLVAWLGPFQSWPGCFILWFALACLLLPCALVWRRIKATITIFWGHAQGSAPTQ